MYALCQIILVEVTLKITTPPKSCNSESKNNHHLPWLSLSKYFLAHVDLSPLLKDVDHP